MIKCLCIPSLTLDTSHHHYLHSILSSELIQVITIGRIEQSGTCIRYE